MKRIFLLFSSAFLMHVSLVGCGGADVGTGNILHAQEGPADTSGLIVPEIKDEAISVTIGTPQIAVDAGFASNGSTITVPSGFTTAQCKFTASVANVDSSSLSTRVTISSAGLVTCLKTVQEREEIPATTVGCVASYTVICLK